MRGCSSIQTTRKLWHRPSDAFFPNPGSGRRFDGKGWIAPVNSVGTRRRETYTALTKTPSLLMRIGIDARELCGKPTGVGRHLAGLLGAWENNPGALCQHLFLYAHGTPSVALPSNAVVRVL